MPSNPSLRQRFIKDTVETVGPARLVTMLYDELVRDLHRSEAGLKSGDLATVNDCLCHAQAIIVELRSGLDTSQWPAGRQLRDLYEYLRNELISANIKKDIDRVVKCRGLIEPLQSAWHEVAGTFNAS